MFRNVPFALGLNERAIARLWVAALVEFRLRLFWQGGEFWWRRTGLIWLGWYDIVIGQIGRCLDAEFRLCRCRWQRLFAQESVDDCLVVDSKRLCDNLLSLQIDAKYGRESKDVAQGVAVTLGASGRELLKPHAELCHYNF